MRSFVVFAVLALFATAYVTPAKADAFDQNVEQSVKTNDSSSLQKMVDQNPAAADDVVLALFSFAKSNIGANEEGASRALNFALSFAGDVSADKAQQIWDALVALADAIPEGSKLYDLMSSVYESFSKNPQIAAYLEAQDVLLAQTPGFTVPSATGTSQASPD